MGRWFTLILVVGLLLGVGGLVQCSRINHQQQRFHALEAVLKASRDTLQTYRDRQGRTVAEKHALEVSVKELNMRYALLSRNQQALVQEVDHLPVKERKKLVSAAGIEQVAHVQEVQQVDTARRVSAYVHDWSYRSDTLRYAVRVRRDTLFIDSLSIPNRVILTQYRDKTGDVKVTVTNTNPLVRTRDADAIVIPHEKTKNRGWLWGLLGLVGGVFLSH